MERSPGATDRSRLNRLRHFQWITLALFLPLVALAAPLYLGFPLTHAQLLALRVAFTVWLLVVDTAALIGFSFALRLSWTVFWRRWGGRMIVVGAYVIFVPFFYLPIAYLSVGVTGNSGLDVALVVVPLAVAFTLISFGLLVGLVELGLDPTVPS